MCLFFATVCSGFNQFGLCEDASSDVEKKENADKIVKSTVATHENEKNIDDISFPEYKLKEALSKVFPSATASELSNMSSKIRATFINETPEKEFVKKDESIEISISKIDEKDYDNYNGKIWKLDYTEGQDNFTKLATSAIAMIKKNIKPTKISVLCTKKLGADETKWILGVFRAVCEVCSVELVLKKN